MGPILLSCTGIDVSVGDSLLSNICFSCSEPGCSREKCSVVLERKNCPNIQVSGQILSAGSHPIIKGDLDNYLESLGKQLGYSLTYVGSQDREDLENHVSQNSSLEIFNWLAVKGYHVSDNNIL